MNMISFYLWNLQMICHFIHFIMSHLPNYRKHLTLNNSSDQMIEGLCYLRHLSFDHFYYSFLLEVPILVLFIIKLNY